jgi:hypothetical protein
MKIMLEYNIYSIIINYDIFIIRLLHEDFKLKLIVCRANCIDLLVNFLEQSY